MKSHVWYGLLIETYTVFGKVVDQDSNPISENKIEGEGPAYPSYTEKDGSFKVTGNGSDAVFRFEDINGEENGGEFASKEETVKLENAVSQEGYVYPKYFIAADVTITLEKKSNPRNKK